MGNYNEHRQVAQKIKSLQLIHQKQHYSILRDKIGKQYLKFLFISHDKQLNNQQAPHLSTIFNLKYLQMRYQQQVVNHNYVNLPKIIAYGLQSQQNNNLLICSLSKIHFVIFQHPNKSLKVQIEERITSGSIFNQLQLLTLIKQCLDGLIQLYQHKNQIGININFNLSEDNIFFLNGNVIISDLVPYMNEIHNFTKNQSIIKRPINKKQSVSNLCQYQSINHQMTKQTFFNKNIDIISSIIEGIIFKFHCFGIQQKNISLQSKSMSTALESQRNSLNKNQINYSFEFQNLLKLMQRNDKNIEELLNTTNQLIFIKQKQIKNQQLRVKYNRKKSHQNLSRLSENKLTSLSMHCYNKNKLIPIKQQNQQTNINRLSLIKSKTRANSVNEKVNLPKQQKINIMENEDKHKQNRNNTKIRLSLRKDIQPAINNQNKQNKCPRRPLSRNNSHQKFINLTNNDNQKTKPKLNDVKVNNPSSNILYLSSNTTKSRPILSQVAIPHINIELVNNDQKISQQIKQKKKVFLKKTTKVQPLIALEQPIIRLTQATAASCQKDWQQNKQNHMNPISKKKVMFKDTNHHNLNTNNNINLNVNNNQLNYQDHNIANLRLIEKIYLPTPIRNQEQYIQNLSSIVSNHNTVSSYGNPLIDDFKTQHSDVEEQGNIQINDIFQPQSNNQNRAYVNQTNNCHKLSSYQSIQLTKQLFNKAEQKIPQFLKQFQLPQKHLLALNNIILKQKDMILQQSFQQSQFNSFRQSIPNILVNLQTGELKRRTSKLLEQVNDKILEQVNSKILEQQIQLYHKTNQINSQQSIISQDSITRGLNIIETSLHQF